MSSAILSGASTILKRDVLDEIGGYVFDPGMFLYGEDMDLGLRIRSAGYRTVDDARVADSSVGVFGTYEIVAGTPGAVKVS